MILFGGDKDSDPLDLQYFGFLDPGDPHIFADPGDRGGKIPTKIVKKCK